MDIKRQLLEKSENNKISCGAAFSISAKNNIPPLELGGILDELKIKLMGCQLGLFGNDEDIADSDKIEITDEFKIEIESRLEGGQLSCKSSWELAEIFSAKRLAIGKAADALGIKITKCQLGAFGYGKIK